MPESPEVNFYYTTFFKSNIGKKLKDIEIISGRYKKNKIEDLSILLNKLPLTIEDIGVKGKNIWIKLNNNYAIYFTHGMTGYWTNKEEKFNHIKLVIDNKELYFNDMRGFGTMTIMTHYELELRLDKLGIDVMKMQLKDKRNIFDKLFTKKNNMKMIGKILIDQNNAISGIGNYLRAEILWDSKISPYRLLKDFRNEDKERLLVSIIKITQYHYNNIIKNKQPHYPSREDTFKVYMRENDPNGLKVSHDKMGSRTIHWVKEIQL